MSAFCPFLSGRDNLRAVARRCSGITEWTWCSDEPDWPNAPRAVAGDSHGTRQWLDLAAARHLTEL